MKIDNQKRKRKDLSIEEKRKLLELFENDKGCSQRFLASKYNLSLGCINNLLKSRNSILVSDLNIKQKRKSHLRNGHQIDVILYEWFQIQRSRNIGISGDILQQKALKIAEYLQIPNFKASNGWLNSFLSRHMISSKRIIGESKIVDKNIILNFKELYMSHLQDYEDRDIYNCDETGLLWKCSLNRTYTISKEDKASGKFSKDRITILFGVNMLGDKLKPLVIGKSKKPRCFKNLDMEKLPVCYRWNAKSWMTLAIFKDWLSNLNSEMKTQGRKILLLLDNAPVHPNDIELSNIELLFFPPNTSSLIQPLDQGIIKSFKDYYKKNLSTSMNFDLSNNFTQEEWCKKVDLYQAVVWIAKAFDSVKSKTISNCFAKSFEMAHVENLTFDNHDLFPCFDINPENDEQLLVDLIEKQKQADCDELEKNDDDSVSELEDTNVTGYEAYQCAKKIERYFQSNIPEKVQKIWELIDDIQAEKESRQLKMTDFITCQRKSIFN